LKKLQCFSLKLVKKKVAKSNPKRGTPIFAQKKRVKGETLGAQKTGRCKRIKKKKSLTGAPSTNQSAGERPEGPGLLGWKQSFI